MDSLAPVIQTFLNCGTVVAVVLIVVLALKAGFRFANGRPAGGYVSDRSPGAPEDTYRLWRRHCDALMDLEAQYVEFETDPWSTFRRPLLADVRVPETADFHQALRRAQDLRTDTAPESRSRVGEFGDAVHAARMAWSIADRHARDIAVPTTSESERRRLRQAQDALRLALDERTTAAERRVALERVEALIQGMTRIQPAAKTAVIAELDNIERREIAQ